MCIRKQISKLISKFRWLIAKLLIVVYAQDWSTKDDPGQPARLKDIEVIFARIVKIAAQFALLGFFVMLVYGGFKYLTSRGNPQATEAARNTLFFAIVGLIVIMAGWLILKILGDVLGFNFLEFKIPEPEG